MKIAMLVEYYWPFDRGGSEWSTHDLAVLLKRQGQEVIIITPNYGTKNREAHDGVQIVRLPFYKKLKKESAFLSPFWTNNTFWFVYSTYQIYSICKKEKVDIIHIQSKAMIVGGYLASLFLRKPVILTLRDYQVLCNFGFCLLSKTKNCGLLEYFFSDLPFFLKHYKEKSSMITSLFYYLLATRARLMDYIVRIATKLVKTRICVSKRQREIFVRNGFSKLEVISSSVIFPDKINKLKKENVVIFVGKLSYGKGVGLFVKSIPQILKKTDYNLKFKIIGDGHLKRELKLLAQKLNLQSRIQFLGHKNHEQALKYMASSKILVAPSVWEEPFGRVVIEALSQNTPVVVSQKGAFPETIQNGRYGLVIKPDSGEIAKAVIQILRNYSGFAFFIEKDWAFIKKKYSQISAEKYIAIYKTLTR